MLSQICKIYNFDKFYYNCRLSNTDKSRWDSNFMNKILKVHGEPEKISIVGPIGFMENIRDAIKTSNQDLETKIHWP